MNKQEKINQILREENDIGTVSFFSFLICMICPLAITIGIVWMVAVAHLAIMIYSGQASWIELNAFKVIMFFTLLWLYCITREHITYQIKEKDIERRLVEAEQEVVS